MAFDPGRSRSTFEATKMAIIEHARLKGASAQSPPTDKFFQKEFLMNDLRARGAASVKLVTLLDRQSARRVQLQPDYFGFLVDEAFLFGYGLGSPDQINRNLPYLAAASQSGNVT